MVLVVVVVVRDLCGTHDVVDGRDALCNKNKIASISITKNENN